MEIEFSKASFKDFENITGMDAWKRAALFQHYLDYLDQNGRLNYRLVSVAGIYTNPIIYPAVSKKNARIRMSVMATHTIEQLDRALNAFEYAGKQLNLPKAAYA